MRGLQGAVHIFGGGSGLGPVDVPCQTRVGGSAESSITRSASTIQRFALRTFPSAGDPEVARDRDTKDPVNNSSDAESESQQGGRVIEIRVQKSTITGG